MRDKREDLKQRVGMERALQFAQDIASDGKITQTELRDLQRHIMRAGMDAMPIEHFSTERGNAEFMHMLEMSGQGPDEDEISNYDFEARIVKSTKKIVRLYLQALYDAGQIEPREYIDQMTNLQLVPQSLAESDAADDEIAAALMDHLHQLDGDEGGSDEGAGLLRLLRGEEYDAPIDQDEADREEMDALAAAWKKSEKARSDNRKVYVPGRGMVAAKDI